jgi:hypothetical protein
LIAYFFILKEIENKSSKYCHSKVFIDNFTSSNIITYFMENFTYTISLILDKIEELGKEIRNEEHRYDNFSHPKFHHLRSVIRERIDSIKAQKEALESNLRFLYNPLNFK